MLTWGRALSACGGLLIGLAGWPLFGGAIFLAGWLAAEWHLGLTRLELRRHARDLRTVQEIGEAAFAASAFDHLIDQLCQILKRHWEFPWLSIELITQSGRQVVGGDDCSLCQVETLICIPLMAGDRLLGTLTLGHPLARKMKPSRLDALRLASSHLAVLIEGRRSQELELAIRDAALEVSRLKSSFLTTISHELRTPLNGLLGMASLLEDSELSPPQREHLQAAVQSGERLRSRVENMLLYTELVSTESPAHPVHLDLHELLRDCLAPHRPRAAEAGLRLDLVIEPEVPTHVQGDPRLAQILTALLDNALKFTEAGGVTLRVSRAESAIQFEVQDSGCGLDPAHAAHLFEPFAQHDESTTRQFGGSGLGLAISQQLAHLLAGTLEVESQPGAGALFRCRLPLPTAPPLSVPVATADPLAIGPAERRPVLVVDDDPVNRKLAQALLSRLGLEVVLATNGVEAVDAFDQEGPFQLILMDCHMPILDGYEATAQIRAREPAEEWTPIVGFTADQTDRNRARCSTAGMDEFIAKPLRPKVLNDLIRRYVGAPPAQRAA